MNDITDVREAPVWTSDYSRHITPDDVKAVLGREATCLADYTETRDRLEPQRSDAVKAKRTVTLLNGSSTSVLVYRILLKERLENGHDDY